MTPSDFKRLGLMLRKELKPFVDEHTPEDFYGNFGGACGFMSYAMYLLLRRLGEKPKLAVAGGIYVGCSHCWVEVDGYIVDLTATQFGYKKPVQVVTRPSEWHKPRKYEGRKALAELKSWNGRQNPLGSTREINRAVGRVMEAL